VKQNKYDESEFFAAYSQMPRSIEGLTAGLEWAAFRALLPDLRDKRLLDLGWGLDFGFLIKRVEEPKPPPDTTDPDTKTNLAAPLPGNRRR